MKRKDARRAERDRHGVVDTQRTRYEDTWRAWRKQVKRYERVALTLATAFGVPCPRITMPGGWGVDWEHCRQPTHHVRLVVKNLLSFWGKRCIICGPKLAARRFASWPVGGGAVKPLVRRTSGPEFNSDRTTSDFSPILMGKIGSLGEQRHDRSTALSSTNVIGSIVGSLILEPLGTDWTTLTKEKVVERENAS